jgi:hypothetical protein
MTLLRCGLLVALALGGVWGCAPGGPDRASDIQNLNGISDDIAAMTMTESPSARAHDPNLPTTLPRSYVTSYTP